MAKKRVLCFGDSLTWGFDPDNQIKLGQTLAEFIKENEIA